MCPIPEELEECKIDLLSMQPSACAEQLTLIDAVSANFNFN